MKVNTSPISGTQELLPGDQATFDALKSRIESAYKKHGFMNIETPSIERTDILFAKAGGDTEKQIYKVFKTGERHPDQAKEALRFDHTVPLARYVIEHQNDLTFPLKVSQLGLNFRGERAQKGRFREFYQCDIDIIGRGSLSLAYDADVISTLLDTLKSFDLGTPILARINNRKILSGFLEALELSDYARDISNIIDHAEKVTIEKTKLDLETLGLAKPQVKKLLDFIEINGSRSSVVTALNNLEISTPAFTQGVQELDQTLYYLESINLTDCISADMKIVRGLDYYTGTVFEFILPEHKHIGSICGGGRYDNLTGYFSEQAFPGVGGSIGLTRLFYVLREHNLIKKSDSELIDYAIIPITPSETDYAFKVANHLREQGHSTTLVLLNKKLGDKMAYATKVAKKGIVIGDSEKESHLLKVKDFATGESEELNLHPAAKADPSDFWATPEKPASFF